VEPLSKSANSNSQLEQECYEVSTHPLLLDATQLKANVCKVRKWSVVVSKLL